MKELPEDVIEFFHAQGFVIVSTVDEHGFAHSSCKGIVKISKDLVYLLDLYRSETYRNIKRNKHISLTAVDEHQFKGYCLKGFARQIESAGLHEEVLEYWHKKLTSRIASRLLKNILGGKKVSHHAESKLPDPKYLIEVKVENVVNLAPSSLVA